MRQCIVELSDNELEEILQNFYRCFNTGYEFERFLKKYLEKIGLEEVVVTQGAHDGGIDLIAVRSGVGDFGGQDYNKYYIQAKRYEPSNSVGVNDVRATYGIARRADAIGVFITTSYFTRDALAEHADDMILIDGKTLVLSCIDNEIGFRYSPVLDNETIRMLIDGDSVQNGESEEVNENIIKVEKAITANDIRAKILSVPGVIFDKIPTGQNEVSIRFNDENRHHVLRINRNRKFVSGVNAIYREYGLIKDNSINLATAYWTWQDDNIHVVIKPKEN